MNHSLIDKILVDNVEALSEYLSSDEYRGLKKRVLSLSEPHTITVKRRGGKYAKLPMIGGEEFLLSGIYIGKRDKAILQYRPAGPADYEAMEMTVEHSIKYLEGFEVVYGSLNVPAGASGTWKGKEEKEKEELMMNLNKYDETYGSW